MLVAKETESFYIVLKAFVTFGYLTGIMTENESLGLTLLCWLSRDGKPREGVGVAMQGCEQSDS